MDLVLSILRCALGMLAVTAASVHSAGRPNRDYSFFSAEHPLPIEGSKRCWRRGVLFHERCRHARGIRAWWSRSPSVRRCSRSLVRCIGKAAFAQIEFATDSPLERDGFELPVPRAIRVRFRDFALRLS